MYKLKLKTTTGEYTKPQYCHIHMYLQGIARNGVVKMLYTKSQCRPEVQCSQVLDLEIILKCTLPHRAHVYTLQGVVHEGVVYTGSAFICPCKVQ